MSSYENLSPQVITRVAREIQDLVRKPTPGIRLMQNNCDNIAEIHAEIDGPEDTPYVEGSFHVKLVLSQDFPNSPPRGFFLTKIYHPNVSSTGDICVNTLKRDWTPTTTLAHVLQVIRCLLIVPFPESSLNDEAGKQFMTSYDDYAKRARLLTTVHALRKSSNRNSSTSRSSSKSSVEKEGKLPAGTAKKEEGEGKEGRNGAKEGAREGAREGGAGVLGSPNVVGLTKRKVHPNQKETALSVDKRLKKKGLKRL